MHNQRRAPNPVRRSQQAPSLGRSYGKTTLKSGVLEDRNQEEAKKLAPNPHRREYNPKIESHSSNSISDSGIVAWKPLATSSSSSRPKRNKKSKKGRELAGRGARRVKIATKSSSSDDVSPDEETLESPTYSHSKAERSVKKDEFKLGQKSQIDRVGDHQYKVKVKPISKYAETKNIYIVQTGAGKGTKEVLHYMKNARSYDRSEKNSSSEKVAFTTRVRSPKHQTVPISSTLEKLSSVVNDHLPTMDPWEKALYEKEKLNYTPWSKRTDFQYVPESLKHIGMAMNVTVNICVNATNTRSTNPHIPIQCASRER